MRNPHNIIFLNGAQRAADACLTNDGETIWDRTGPKYQQKKKLIPQSRSIMGSARALLSLKRCRRRRSPMREQVGPPKAQGTAPCSPYIPTSKQQQDCRKELMRFVIDAELPFKKLDNPRRASRGQLGCSLKWRPWVKFEQQHQEQQSHQPSRFLVCLAALDNQQALIQFA
jgi:hypothetical protein